jgi:asparagine synthase (glutamine-hydrolysing)
MCGIAGWVDWRADLEGAGATVSAMADTMACRGPDARGSWVSARAAFGHRRLVVIDPEGGAQPMVRRADGRTHVIVYNGEIYNMPELRSDLEARGLRPTSRSDTELILLSYVAWGTRCVERLNGIFAFAVWDEAAQSLFLARDRIGVKPLFYAQRDQGLVFASELKGLLAHPGVRPEVDAEGLAEVLAIGPTRTPGHGILRDVHEIRPAHALTFDRRGLSDRCYWRVESRPHEAPLDATAATVRELLQDIVARQLVSDVPLASLLSGGLDSSAVTALAVRARAEGGLPPPRTYSVDYADDRRFFAPNSFEPTSDADWVPIVAAHLGTDHHTVELEPADLAEALSAATRARDLPGMADVDSSLLLFSREIKRRDTVALSGECADEVFGGYPWFHRQQALEADTFPWALWTRERARLWSPEVVAATRPVEYVEERYRQALAEVPRLAGETGAAARIREIFHLTLTRWMPVLLDRKDRMSMATGLEVRVPFCDHRLVEYVWNIPWEMKCCDGQAKGILRRALQGMLPPEVLGRRKTPYPKTHHPVYRDAVRRGLQAVLQDPAAPLRDIVDPAAVRAVLDAPTDLDVPFFGQLMRLPQLYAYLIQINDWLTTYRIRIVS